MPTKRKRIGRKVWALTRVELAYLTDQELEDEDWDSFQLDQLRSGLAGDKARELWGQFKDVYLPAFIKANPGKRPCPWWQWDAPRQPAEGNDCFWDGLLPDPRRRLSGTGEVHGGYVPQFSYGIPHHWDEDTLDPSDPLIFESEASYLQRHGLLTAPEEKWLKRHPEALDGV